MKKLIFTLLLLVTVNLNAVVVSHNSHSTRNVPVDNSLHTSLTRKDYHFHCERCGKDFVISNMIYHEGTDMYFYYMNTGKGIKVLQPYEDRKFCDKCENKLELTVFGFFLLIVLLIISIVCYISRD